MSAWESTRTPFFKKPVPYLIIALRNNPESSILSCSSAIVFSGRGLFLYVRQQSTGNNAASSM